MAPMHRFTVKKATGNVPRAALDYVAQNGEKNAFGKEVFGEGKRESDASAERCKSGLFVTPNAVAKCTKTSPFASGKNFLCKIYFEII